MFKQPPGMNSFGPWIGPGGSYDVLFKMLQALGVRYVLLYGPFNEAEERKFAGRTFPPRQPPNSPGQWQLYQLSDPNVGNYSPTEIVLAGSAAKIIADLAGADFDLRRRVILAAGQGPLVPAHDMRLTMNRGGGFHITGHSDGASLIILPQQFTNCLKASNSRVRIVRANLLWTGVVLSGDIDTRGLVRVWHVFPGMPRRRPCRYAAAGGCSSGRAPTDRTGPRGHHGPVAGGHRCHQVGATMTAIIQLCRTNPAAHAPQGACLRYKLLLLVLSLA